MLKIFHDTSSKKDNQRGISFNHCCTMGEPPLGFHQRFKIWELRQNRVTVTDIIVFGNIDLK